MQDENKTKAELIEELSNLRQILREFEALQKGLQQSLTKYQAFINNITDACLEFDLRGHCTFCNEAAYRDSGYTHEEFMALTHREHYASPEEADRVFNIFREIYRTGIPQGLFTVESRKRDGSTRMVEMSVSLIRDAAGQPAGFRCVARNITKRTTMEEQQQRYSNFIENIEDACIEYDLKGLCIFCNSAVPCLYGYPEAEFKKLSQPQRHPSPEMAEKVFKKFNEVYRTGQSASAFEYEILRKDGSIKTVEASISLIRDAQEQATGFRCIIRDITDRKKTREDLEKYRTFVENIDDACFESDLRGNITFINHNACNIFGYPYEELMGLNNRAYTTPGTAKVAYNAYNGIYRTGIPATLHDYEIIQKNGHVRYLELWVSLTRDGDGHPVGFRSIARDTTESRNILKERERSRIFLENVNDACWEADLKGEITFNNEAFWRMLGYAPEEYGPLTRKQRVNSPEEYERMKKVFHELYLTGVPINAMPFKFRHKDGGTKILEVSATLIRDREGRAVGFRGISRDVTDREKGEAEQARYRNFLENVEDGCFETDLVGNYTFFNEATTKYIGYSAEELRHITYQDYSTPEEAKKVFRTFRNMFRTGEPVKGLIHNIIRKDGEIRTLEVNASVIRDGSGKVIGARGINRDITERNKLMEQLNQAQKLEAIGTLAGGIAHDFNNLLMGIQGYASLMLIDCEASHPFYEKLKAIEAQVKSGADLTKQLLGYARGGRYEVKPIDLNDMIEKSSIMFGRTKKEIRMHQNLAAGLWPVRADRGQLEQVLLNLFVNAWQAMPGGGAIYLETQNMVIDESDVKAYDLAVGPYVKITVTDTGVGMDEKTRQRIFEPFFTTKEMGRGAGLGLASVYGIVRGHQGTIHVYSEKGHGATFNIYLPASEDEVVTREQQAAKTVRGSETILLVDDEPMITDVTGAMIKGLGYQALIAHNGEEAVEVYRTRQDKIDLVIMDMIMPGSGGGPAIDRLLAINPQVKVILSSGYSLNGEAKAIMDRGGARAFLQKPFPFEELSVKLREVLDA